SKPNAFTGEEEELEFTGQELAFYIASEDGAASEEGDEYCFMDARLKDDPHTEIANGKRQKGNDEQSAIDFTLQQLVEHFLIPDVPDVAAVNPDGYNNHVA